MGYESWRGAVGEVRSVITEGHCTHDLWFLSFCLCFPLGCMPDEVAMSAPLVSEINWILGFVSTDVWRTLWCRSVRGPRSAPAALIPFKHWKRSRWLTVTRQRSSPTLRHEQKRRPHYLLALPLSAHQLCCNLGWSPELCGFLDAPCPSRDCKVGWEDSRTHSSPPKRANILENN